MAASYQSAESLPGVAVEGSCPRVAVVVNPSKFSGGDALRVRGQLRDAAVGLGWAEPMWLETTVEDPGRGQAQAALDEGVDVVCALGGDGTVRAVASALIGTGVPLGLLPGGTGNLLARNLGLPLDSPVEALRVALRGVDRRLDVGRVRLELLRDEQVPLDQAQLVEEFFLIMAGIGFDASMIAGAPEELKAQVGAVAYVWSGLRHLRGERFEVRMWTDGGPGVLRKARTVLFANVSELQGGISLLPAEPDDGLLDALVLTPKSLTGWLSVATHVLTRGRAGSERVHTSRFQSMQLRLRVPQHIQLDGDAIGLTRALDTSSLPGALVVRVRT
ncbi:diacylglycerol/lipid kinase family protein [Dermatophilus congolensis]|uniref:Diacylglycerol kinase n=1 Tax=Dermatophilus congolensis TaxID=1863 RepID=A0A239V7A0_9MICO|nr:diacylglycerol kinase family protein [Dermatophilus congolensis]MBO3130248.1 diacylglycerol kinase family lipid kinase [Dermatophilus congolensis]MBO3131122.1 diacylglycerol kinase family lipid kinase [Dermatophilus congolensis]MBO3134719.1 diacylglycerol kinase family lipid kinase [Dermatophilus congolensis]MBO3136954.1 diacylglycerol kinase family lipid kinase [Dermatophilus congolensis]MBO3139200.1 diacylglycerol kinase family lipid kinase [Dermatophilus congolensis]